MENVSRPLLIVLAATAALFAVWLFALRPKPVPVEDTPLAATKAIPQAKQAAAASDAANAKVQAASGGAATAATASAAAAPAAAAAQPTATASNTAAQKASTPATGAGATQAERRNAAIVKAVKDGKVVVLLFWNGKSADDIATRGALRDVDRHGGKVVVRVAPIRDVGRYTAVTRGVKIAQSPTTLIIGRKGDTRVIVGLTEPREVSQAVGDALAGR